MPRQDPKDPVLATNRKAFHDYTVLDRFEAGIQLVGRCASGLWRADC